MASDALFQAVHVLDCWQIELSEIRFQIRNDTILLTTQDEYTIRIEIELLKIQQDVILNLKLSDLWMFFSPFGLKELEAEILNLENINS